MTDPPDREVSLQGRAFMITGASRGIGRAVALALGARGATVAVHFGRRDDLAREVVAAVEAGGGRAFAVGADLASPDAPGRLVDDVRSGLETLGAQPALHGLVLSAGELVVGGLEELTAESFDRAMASTCAARCCWSAPRCRCSRRTRASSP